MDSQNQYYYAQQRPSYSQPVFGQPSIISSPFQSSSSLSSMGSMSTSPNQTNLSSRHSPTLVSAAPMSSPSSQSHFSSLPGPMAQNPFQQMPQQPQPHRGSFSESQRPGGNDTSAFLHDFSLIAEAAKRAQVAVMMRDFDDLEM